MKTSSRFWASRRTSYSSTPAAISRPMSSATAFFDMPGMRTPCGTSTGPATGVVAAPATGPVAVPVTGLGEPGALAGPVAVGARIDVHLGGRVLAVDVPCEDVQIDWASDRVVPGKLTYTAAAGWVPESPGDALNNYGQRSHVTALLETREGRDEVDLGWWQHQSWEEQDNGTVKVECLDLMQLLEQDPMAWPSSPPRGATALSEAQRLAGTLPVVLDPGAPKDHPRSRGVYPSMKAAMAARASGPRCSGAM